MTRDERILMTELMRVNTQAADFALEFADGHMSAETEIAFACQLNSIAQQLVRHAENKERQ